MKLQVKKIGSNTFGNWCYFNAIINSNLVITGIASYDEILDLKESEVYTDLILHAKMRNGKTYYRIVKNS